MKSKNYAFSSMVFIILVGLYVYSFEGATYQLDYFGISLELPVAIWVMVPLFLFFVLSYLHIVVHGMGSYFILKRYDSDYKNLIALLKSKVLKQKNQYFEFKTKDCKSIGEFVSNLDVSLSYTGFKSKDLGLDDILISFHKIENGEYVKDLDLDPENPIYIKNIENRLNQEPKFSLEILKNSPAYDRNITKIAYQKIVESLDKKDILKYMEHIGFCSEDAFLILERYKNSELELSIEEIKDIVSLAEFTREDFIKLANMLKSDFAPENLIAIFESLSNRFEKAEESYIYVLLDLEMIEKAKGILELSNEDSFLKLKAYVSLKEAGEHYNIELFI